MSIKDGNDLPAVTGNAIILVGYLAGGLYGRSPYAVMGADPAAGTIKLQHTVTENTFLVSVVQLEGTE